jgi:mono/diheme cytochrome c family protein
VTHSRHIAPLLFLAAAQVVLSTAIEAADISGSGQQEFSKVCAKCHLEGGTGAFMLGRRLGKDKALLEGRNDLQAECIRYVVRNGILGMPAITRVEVTDADLDAIVRYLTPNAAR